MSGISSNKVCNRTICHWCRALNFKTQIVNLTTVTRSIASLVHQTKHPLLLANNPPLQKHLFSVRTISVRSESYYILYNKANKIQHMEKRPE